MTSNITSLENAEVNNYYFNLINIFRKKWSKTYNAHFVRNSSLNQSLSSHVGIPIVTIVKKDTPKNVQNVDLR